jgi:DNA-binding IscR family transcriptional regulator
LAEVYRVLEPDGPLAPSPCEPSERCPVGSGMRAAFDEAAKAARAGVLSALARTTLDEIARAALRRGRERDAGRRRVPRRARGG